MVTHLYDKSEFLRAKNTRKKYIYGIIGSFLLTAAINVIIVLLRHPIGLGLAKFLNIFLSAVYLCALWFFFSIKFRIIHRNYVLLRNIFTGIIDENNGIFIRFDDTAVQKEGVDFYCWIFEEKVIKRPDMSERRVLIRYGYEHPNFEPKDVIHYHTHAGVLLDYEIVKKQNEVK